MRELASSGTSAPPPADRATAVRQRRYAAVLIFVVLGVVGWLIHIEDVTALLWALALAQLVFWMVDAPYIMVGRAVFRGRWSRHTGPPIDTLGSPGDYEVLIEELGRHRSQVQWTISDALGQPWPDTLDLLHLRKVPVAVLTGVRLEAATELARRLARAGAKALVAREVAVDIGPAGRDDPALAAGPVVMPAARRPRP